MDVVLVGLPGSGKSVVGRRLASRHGATFLDLDESIERATGRTIPEIFESDGEAAFRALERSAVADLGPADAAPTLKRVISTGGGTVIDPRNRWQLFRGRVPIWLDARPEVLAQRLRRSVRVRPLVTGRDPIGAVRELGRARERYYAAAHHLNSVAEVASVVDAADRLVARGTARRHGAPAGVDPARRPGPWRGHRGGGRRRGPATARGTARDPRVGARGVGRRRRTARR